MWGELDWERYEDFLGSFARDYPSMFWTYNFFSAAGGIAIGWWGAALFLPRMREFSLGFFVVAMIMLSVLNAWWFQR